MLETTTVLGQLLRPEGYSRETILGIATAMIVDNEHDHIRANVPMHLMALKKTLLYAIPVIAPPNGTVGIPLTSQVTTPAIQYSKKLLSIGLTIGDKFRLLGFKFPAHLINHLDHSIYQQKYFDIVPDKYNVEALDISSLPNIESKNTRLGKLFIIHKKAYEDTELFNHINRLLANKLSEEMSVLMAVQPMLEMVPFKKLPTMVPYNNLPFIDKLNEILEAKIDKTFTASFYEILHITANWVIYNQISLLGFESAEVNQHLQYLKYVETQKTKMKDNIIELTHKRLRNTRAEKICRDKYPYFFDYTDRRSIFVNFKQFSIAKLPTKELTDIEILLEKELAVQDAILSNKCEHIQHLAALDKTPFTEVQQGVEKHLGVSNPYKNIEPYINFDALSDDGMYPCKLCQFPLICAHTVELYEAIAASPDTTDGSDHIYWARQKIINRFKQTNLRLNNVEDTETLFTYYCKYCGSDIGKSEDIIQATLKTKLEASEISSNSPNDIAIMNAVTSTISSSMNINAIPFNKKTIAMLIFTEIKDQILMMARHVTRMEDENLDIFLRYLAHAFTLVSLIALNMTKIKSSESALIIHGGASLKDELLEALKLLKSVPSYKRIGITDDKIKSLLIEAFKFANRAFSSETTILKAPSYKEHLEISILSSPLTDYARHIYKRFSKHSCSALEIMGIDMDALFPKKRKDVKLESQALFRDMYIPSRKQDPLNVDVRYIIESYTDLVKLAQADPIKTGYISIITPPLNKFISNYQSDMQREIMFRRTTPIYRLPVENSREYDFNLKILQIAYCLEPVRSHRWIITKEKQGSLTYKCKYCKLLLTQASKSNNSKIDLALDERMLMEAFFEFYTIACPIKDAHIFESDKCIQCGVTKSQLINLDQSYYKKYSSTYINHRKSIIALLLKSTNSIISYPSPIGKTSLRVDTTKVDDVKIESSAMNIGKLFDIKDLHLIGMDNEGHRLFQMVESYMRLLYSHYIFAKNVSIYTKTHPDPVFFALIKKLLFNGVKTKKISFPDLPPYPTSTSNADKILLDLFTITLSIIDKGDAVVNEIMEFIINKIMKQDQRHKQFDFARLRATPVDDAFDELISTDTPEEEEDDNDMFNSYDIDADDIEDNENGEINGD